MKIKKIVYWIATGLLSALLVFSLYNYIFNFEVMTEAMEGFNFPPFLIYFLIIAKALGLIAILSNIKGVLKEWAYAGFFYNFLLAFLAHYMAGDGEGGGAVVALLLLVVSYVTGKQVRPWIIRG
ncbi:MAG TPA: DoxX family protein [Pricia antarctica]|uniref:DoxX family protein n=1 Tax=Pricia antarctica TaxID=641691 RepID=A0A831QPH4_9FLAO|nr:DoxX family protein [Pricia antarctica]